jgi:hypothetical protein
MSDELPDPETAARIVESQASDVGGAVTHDVLLDAADDANCYARQLRSMYVDLDGICDNLGLFPETVEADLRDLQSETHGLLEWTQEFAHELEARREDHEVASDD